MTALFSLENRTALLTGGLSGYGWMIAEGLIEQGASRVYVAEKEPFTPRTVIDAEGQSKLDEIYKNIISIQCDITTEEGREKLFCEISTLESSLNILINSSLYASEVWDEVIKYNLEAPIKLTEKFLPLLKASTNPDEGTSISTEQIYGKVINISTVDGINPPQISNFAFSSSNAGINHASKSFAVQYIRHKIVVSSITVGLFNVTPNEVNPANRLEVTQRIPAKRLGHKDDIVAAITYLDSRAGDYCVGAHLVVDGGVSEIRG
jgi:NAD(P)-dependent dehydrogenase (short-subunit alcohol dehydrogenase family)